MDRRIEIRFDEIVNDKFKPFMRDSSRWAVLKGGAGSGKSKVTAQKILFRVMTEEGHRFCCARKVYRTVKASQFTDLVDFIYQYGWSDLFKINRTELKITYIPNGNEIIFVGLDNREKMKSISGITGWWLEEVTDFEERDLTQLDLRLRGKTRNYKQTIMTFNPVSELHWIKNKFFSNYIEEAIQKTGHANLPIKYEVGGKLIELNASIYHSTYRDNKFLEPEYIAFLLSLEEDDPHYFEIYAEGKWGSIGNLVYPNGFIRTEEYPNSYDEIIYGLDFGWIHPTALVKVGILAGEYYLDELIYQSKLSNKNLIEEMRRLGIDESDYIYCDSARPDFINEICEAGFNAVKSEKDVMAGLDKVRSSRVHTKSSNVNINREVDSYKWAEDENGKPIEGKVVKIRDDAMDAIRYPIFTHSLKYSELKMFIA